MTGAIVAGLWGNIRAECEIISHLPPVRWVVLAGLICQLAILSQTVHFWTPVLGYYFSQSMVAIAQLSWWSILIISAYMGAGDAYWKTAGVRLTSTTRGVVVATRVITLVGCTMASVAVCAIVGWFLDLSAGTASLSLSTLAQFLSTWVIITFWSLLGLLVASVAKSLWVTITAIIGYYLVERLILDVWLPAGVVRFLPANNQYALLHLIESETQGFIASPHPIASSPGSAAVYFTTAMILICVLLWLRARQDNW